MPPPLTPCIAEQEEEGSFAAEQLKLLCDGMAQQRPSSLRSMLNSLALIAPLLNAIPNVMFFIKDRQGKIIGIAGISHDLQEAKANHPAYQRLATLDIYIRQHYNRPIAMDELRTLTGLSVAQIERYCKRIFHLTPRQMIHKVRLEKATELLASDLPITDIAIQCGYTDHSAFSRQFKAMTGATPRDFRAMLVP